MFFELTFPELRLGGLPENCLVQFGSGRKPMVEDWLWKVESQAPGSFDQENLVSVPLGIPDFGVNWLYEKD